MKRSGGEPRSLLLEAFCSRVLEALHPVDGPEVLCKLGVRDVLVGHVEVALVAPPGIENVKKARGRFQYLPTNAEFRRAAPLPRSCGQ